MTTTRGSHPTPVAYRCGAAALLACVIASSIAAQTTRTALTRGVWVIEGATLIPMTSPAGREPIIRNATVLVRDGRIAAVGAASAVTVPQSARRVDGRGKYVIPGLVDMHAHLYADEWVPDSVAPYELGVSSEARRTRYIAVRNRMVRAIVDSGGHIMAGSDGPGGLMGYGWTLHRELEVLVAAGLSPYEALAAATTVPAAFLNAERDWGRVAPGQRADLVLLDANPLEDIRNTTRIVAMAVGGRLFERAALDSMLVAAGKRLNP